MYQNVIFVETPYKLERKSNQNTNSGPSIHINLSSKQGATFINEEISIRDARTPQPGEIVFNTMRHTSDETVQRSGYFQSSVSYIKV